MKQKIILSWSGGKDSALAFYELLQQGKYEITLLTTISEKYGRISIHGVGCYQDGLWRPFFRGGPELPGAKPREARNGSAFSLMG